MEKNKITFEDIKEFVDDEVGNPGDVFTENTLIEDDLGITGEDAWDLIKKFAVKFGVDISQFKPEKYFYPEPSLLASFTKKVEPLTLGDLTNAAIEGKLDDTVIGRGV